MHVIQAIRHITRLTISKERAYVISKAEIRDALKCVYVARINRYSLLA